MVYTIEKRFTFGKGTMETHWEVREYTHRTRIGALANGKTLKAGTKAQCEQYCRRVGINAERI